MNRRATGYSMAFTKLQHARLRAAKRETVGMPEAPNEWVLLVYKIPTQPTRLRLSIWRKLQRMGALYLQDAVCMLPLRHDLVENMFYVVAAIEEMGGACHLFSAADIVPGGSERLVDEFRALADKRMHEISERIDTVQQLLDKDSSPIAIERAEEELKRERVALMRSRRLAYFGSTAQPEVERNLETVRHALDDIYRSGK